ncbi:FliM/FliN family flagellar motor switch protein [Oricola thermophila]|uniref:FliM/FliN family flagellar motor switch protein n=1 Tax=Oricola thermophila TaxID=2742145 RepID=A0A6N1VGL7_9HYPH|nr:FliM/FliN family flagellar motor switch protein [Oricola thermophila]QKV19653.1 FliM/FliN family flagellar motor switch protein [Oricola thermophila]
MNQVHEPTAPNLEIFDRLLGRKGDATRLDPAIHAVTRFFGERLQGILSRAGFEAAFEATGHRHTSAEELLGALENGAICTFLGVQANQPQAFLITDFGASSVIAELMLGGDPEFASLSASRPPTDMECDLVRQFGDFIGEALQTTLSVGEQPKALRIIRKIEEVRDGEEQEPIVAFDVTMTFGEAKPTLTLAVTHTMLLRMARPPQETVKRPQHGARETPNRQPEPATRPNPKALAVKVPVTGSVVLPAISLDALGRLRPGDVLPLSEEGDAKVKLKVKGRPLYDCSLGRKGAHYAICLERPHQAMADALNGIGLSMPNPDSEETHHE